MTHFEDLKIFENKLDSYADDLFNLVGWDNLVICGGVSRVLHGHKHTPKDFDLACANNEVFKTICDNYSLWFPGHEYEIRDNQRILDSSLGFLIEIWDYIPNMHQSYHKYEGKIPYAISKRMKKVRNA